MSSPSSGDHGLALPLVQHLKLLSHILSYFMVSLVPVSLIGRRETRSSFNVGTIKPFSELI